MEPTRVKMEPKGPNIDQKGAERRPKCIQKSMPEKRSARGRLPDERGDAFLEQFGCKGRPHLADVAVEVRRPIKTRNIFTDSYAKLQINLPVVLTAKEQTFDELVVLGSTQTERSLSCSERPLRSDTWVSKQLKSRSCWYSESSDALSLSSGLADPTQSGLGITTSACRTTRPRGFAFGSGGNVELDLASCRGLCFR